MLLKTSDFEGQLTIGQFQLNKPILEWYIENKEALFFADYFSLKYYIDLKARLESANPEEKEIAEKEFAKIKFPLTAYVWLYYTTNETEKTVGSGVVLEDSQNSQPVNIDTKCTRIYNEMIKHLRESCGDIEELQTQKLRYRNYLGIC